MSNIHENELKRRKRLTFRRFFVKIWVYYWWQTEIVFLVYLRPAEERKGKVFQKGERVVCGNKGVCEVGEITTLDISGIDKEREYYILKPLYLSSSTVYIPVDTAEGSMRKVLAHEEAESLIHSIPQIPLITIANDKLLEQEYKNCLKTSNCGDLIRIIKTIYLRKKKREEAGRKETAIDARYFRIAEDHLYGELAVSLGMPRENVENYITQAMEA